MASETVSRHAQVPTTPVAANKAVSSSLADLEESFPILHYLSAIEERSTWEKDVERVIKIQETRRWGKSIESSRLVEFLKLHDAPYMFDGMPEDPLWNTILNQTGGFNRLLQLFDSCWPGANRFFRSIDQCVQFGLMLGGQLHNLTVLPTGSGKTLPVVLYAKWLETNLDQIQGHIIMLIPYVLLYSQMQGVMEEASISFSKWETESRLGPNGTATVIAVSLEHSVRPEFWADMSPLLAEKRIKGIVIDEAHAALDDRSFRSSFQFLAPRLATLPAPVWLLTATCPPRFEGRLWSSLGINNQKDTTTTLRGYQGKKDMEFSVQEVEMKEQQGFTETCASVIKAHLSTFDPTEHGKLLVLTHERKDVEEVAGILGVDCIHGGVPWDERERILRNFQDKVNGHPALVANKACYYGMDIGCITYVIFIGLPDSLLSLQQAVGRAGRRGQAVQCQIVLPPGEKKDPKFPPTSMEVDFAGESLVPLLSRGTCVDGLLQIFFDQRLILCRKDASSGIRCSREGQWPFPTPFPPQTWLIGPPPIRITPALPHWINSERPIPPPPLLSLHPALVKEREKELLRNHHIHLWEKSLLQIVKAVKRRSKSRKCLYCLCKDKIMKNTNHTWFRCFPSDSKLKNYAVWDKKVVATQTFYNGVAVYKAKDAWKRYYLPVFRTSSEGSQLPGGKRKVNFRPALSPVCGKCHGPVWEEEFHGPVQDSYGPCQHEDLILEAIFVLWAETKIREEFLQYLEITDPTFTIHPDEKKGGRFAEWLWSESEVRGWCNAALWAVPWFAYVYRKGELGRERYGVL